MISGSFKALLALGLGRLLWHRGRGHGVRVVFSVVFSVGDHFGGGGRAVRSERARGRVLGTRGREEGESRERGMVNIKRTSIQCGKAHAMHLHARANNTDHRTMEQANGLPHQLPASSEEF